MQPSYSDGVEDHISILFDPISSHHIISDCRGLTRPNLEYRQYKIWSYHTSEECSIPHRAAPCLNIYQSFMFCETCCAILQRTKIPNTYGIRNLHNIACRPPRRCYTHKRLSSVLTTAMLRRCCRYTMGKILKNCSCYHAFPFVRGPNSWFLPHQLLSLVLRGVGLDRREWDWIVEGNELKWKGIISCITTIPYFRKGSKCRFTHYLYLIFVLSVLLSMV